MKYDRNTIIDALEHCTRLDGDNFPHPNCIECPVTDDCRKCVGHIPYEMKEPLLELLKEKQPRVLSKREAYDLPNETDVWCEQRDSKRVIAMTTLGKKYFMLRPTFSMGLESNDIRFWTARPTEEQRKAVPWETPITDE